MHLHHHPKGIHEPALVNRSTWRTFAMKLGSVLKTSLNPPALARTGITVTLVRWWMG